MESGAEFCVGCLVVHKRFGYRGVIVDVDAGFQLSEEWYDEIARSRPPKDKPWYHVLVHCSDNMTYVAERHLEIDESNEPIDHPWLLEFFADLEQGRYVAHKAFN